MFKVGSKVKWTSQSSGYKKEKEGVIVSVVLPNQRPDRDRFLSLYRSGCGWGRKEESYVVAVKNKFYWPLVKHLVKA